MNLEKISDTNLLTQTKNLAQKERELLTQVLHHLREIDRRKLFAKLRYRSLFEYAVKELGYSEDQAYRRISAARLLADVPEIEAKLNSGALTLASLSVAAQAMRVQKKTTRNASRARAKSTQEIISLVENKSKREAEEIVLGEMGFSRNMLRPEKVFVKENHVELRITITKDCEEKIALLKAKLAHAHPVMSTAELLEKLCGEELARQEKKMAPREMQPKLRQQVRVSKQAHGKNEIVSNISSKDAPLLDDQEDLQQKSQKSRSSAQADPLTNPLTEPSAEIVGDCPTTRAIPHAPSSTKRKTIPVSLKQKIWQRDHGACTNCGSRYALEYDHILPRAKGGSDDIENLRLLCKSCNQRAAIEVFGVKKMQPYFSGKSG